MRKPVMRVDVDPPIEYESITDAARKNHLCREAMRQNIISQRTTFGQFIIVGASEAPQPVRCIETGKEYESIRQASKKTGINYWTLWRAIRKGYSLSHNGVKTHWETIP